MNPISIVAMTLACTFAAVMGAVLIMLTIGLYSALRRLQAHVRLMQLLGTLQVRAINAQLRVMLDTQPRFRRWYEAVTGEQWPQTPELQAAIAELEHIQRAMHEIGLESEALDRQPAPAKQ